MYEIADIKRTKRGKIQVKFNLLGIYDLLRNLLGFRYVKLNGYGYYVLKNKDELFEIVNFSELSYEFRKYVTENYDFIVMNGEISYVDFINAYYDSHPIKDGNICKKYLGDNFTLSDNNRHLLLMQIDYKYRRDFKCQEMYKFLKDNNFSETEDKIGNFRLNKPLFYKRLTSECFIVFNRPFITENNNDCTFDFWKVKVQSEKDFLKKKLNDDNYIIVRLGFDLERDIELCYETKNNVC